MSDPTETGESAAFLPGQRVMAAELGAGVVIESASHGHVRVMFASGGERSMPVGLLRPALSREQTILSHAAGGRERQRRAFFCAEAHRLPLLESAASLTSAKIDLLPHQVVLTHRVATNAFAKHDLLIASIDTLKQPARMKRLEEAPEWDLVVFDEAHHLTAYRNGGKVTRTQNYKLAELLRRKSRDVLLLSATPHQGDHFRFWMLVKLLDSTLFADPQEMLALRHRLNSVIFRRTKADACRPDGSALFARRWVHTESFLMAPYEKEFYSKLTEYVAEGFALAKRQGRKGMALGFVMTIFQKISASSFAAVQRTLRRRLIALAVHEGLVHEGHHEVEKRNTAWAEARELIRVEYGLGESRIAEAAGDKIFLDIKRKLLKAMQEEQLELVAGEYSSEAAVAAGEEMAITAVEHCLPQERQMIREVLAVCPAIRETKVEKLLGALGTLWEQNPEERMVVFATYLGSVEMLDREITAAYPGKGVVTLRGGDHGAKLAAEKRFKLKDGPRILICTAAGREGINLQHARILFNFDLPFNPMDLEQRIGRIHRYGQQHTAQVYNLVLSDTIEGSIFLMPEDNGVHFRKADLNSRPLLEKATPPSSPPTGRPPTKRKNCSWSGLITHDCPPSRRRTATLPS